MYLWVRFNKLEEEAFLKGDGTGKPSGILKATGGAPVGVTAASQATISIDEMIDLYHSLKSPEVDQKYRQLTMRYDRVKAQIEEVASQIEARAIKRTKSTAFLEDLKMQGELLTEFDEPLWRRSVEQVVVYKESKISVIFKDLGCS